MLKLLKRKKKTIKTKAEARRQLLHTNWTDRCY